MSVNTTMSLLGYALQSATVALGSMLALSVYAAAPGVTGAAGTPVFNLNAAAMRVSQPNGKAVYTWGYGCTSTAGNGFAPAAISGANCPSAQLPGPTLIVNEGDVVTVTLTNNLPAAAGNTSILFPGFQVATNGGATGLLTQEAFFLIVAVIARRQGHAGLLHQGLGRGLRAHGANRRGRWSDKYHAGLRATFREGRVLRQEPVARMYGLRAAAARGLQNRISTKVALGGGQAPYAERFVAGGDVARLRVGVRIDRDRVYTQAPRRARNPAGDLTAIGNQ